MVTITEIKRNINQLIIGSFHVVLALLIINPFLIEQINLFVITTGSIICIILIGISVIISASIKEV
jgi:hypothetical protein